MSLIDHAKEDLVELFVHNLPRRWKDWLRGTGFKRTVLVVLAAVGVLVKFVILPWAVSHAVQTWAEAHRIRLEVGDWSADLHDLTVAAHDVSVRTTGPYSKNELFKAEAVTIDLSLWNRLDRGPWVREVVVKNPYLYVERQLSGYWNWQEVVGGGDLGPPRDEPGAPAWPSPSGVQSAGFSGEPSTSPGALSRALGWMVTALLWVLRLLFGLAFAGAVLFALIGLISLWRPAGVLGLRNRSTAGGALLAGGAAAIVFGLLGLVVRPSAETFDLQSLRVQGGRVEWVENLPGQSGGGVIHTSRATLFLDDLDLGAENLHAADRSIGPTRFSLEGRLGGGRISAHGDVQLAPPSAAVEASLVSDQAGTPGSASTERGAFELRGDLYVENLQAGVLAQLAPDAALMPNTGALTGLLRLTRPLQPLELQCRTRNVYLSGFGWAPNPDAPNWRPSPQAARYLGSHRRTGPLPDDTDCGCKGDMESCRPFAAVMAAVTDAGLGQAPHEVQRAAAYDQAQFTGVLAGGNSPETSAKLAELVGSEMSAELLNPAAPGNAASSGAFARAKSRVLHIFGH